MENAERLTISEGSRAPKVTNIKKGKPREEKRQNKTTYRDMTEIYAFMCSVLVNAILLMHFWETDTWEQKILVSIMSISVFTYVLVKISEKLVNVR